jgi:hypothetical protein
LFHLVLESHTGRAFARVQDIVAGTFATIDWRNHPMPIEPQYCKQIEPPERVANCEKSQADGRVEVASRRQITVAIVIAPPLVMLVLGLALWWVAMGFGPRPPAASASR